MSMHLGTPTGSQTSAHGGGHATTAIRRVKPWHRATEQHYRLRGWRRWLMCWMFSPMLLIGLLMAISGDAGASAAGAVLMLMAGTILAGWEWLWRRTVLELSATGPRLRQLGYALQTPWSNIAGLHTEPGREGLILIQPLDTPGARRLASYGALYGQYAGDQASWIAHQRFIPIDAFAWHLHKGALAADMAAKAPQLAAAIQALNAPAPAKPAPDPAQRRCNIRLWLFIAALVVASMVLGWKQPAGLGRVIDYAYAVLAPLLALQAALSTWQVARQRLWGMTLLMAASTLVALGWCVVALQRVV